MSRTMLNHGIYDLAEAAVLVGASTDQLVAWSHLSSRKLKPVVTPAFERAFSFDDLVTLRVAARIRQLGVSDRDLRCGVDLLRQRFSTELPLATKSILDRLATSGESFLADLGDGLMDIGKGEQGVFESVVQLDLQRIHFNADGEPDRWMAADHVVLDPRVQAGAPCVADTRVLTATIYDLIDQVPAEDLALDFDLTVEQILAAVDFETTLHGGVALAL